MWLLISFYFTDYEPLFAYFQKSRYAEKYIMTSSLSQIAALEYQMRHNENGDELDELDQVKQLLHIENPCKFGLWIVGIQNGMLNGCTLNF